jgi:predicted nucleic acid-binding protein
MSIDEPPVRVYSDTTVFGGIVDPEFEKTSRLFFQRVQEKRFTLVLSALVVQEISRAPQEVQELLALHLPAAEIVDITADALNLQQAYIDAGFVRAKSHNDALHVAVASIHRCALIVSWNFSDIVNFRKIPLYNAVNAAQGYENLAIYSPLEVTKDDDETF